MATELEVNLDAMRIQVCPTTESGRFLNQIASIAFSEIGKIS